MLVIASDWHLADPTTGMGMPFGAYELFQERLCDMAYDASQRGDDTYRPIDSFDLLLLGDIFDVLRSNHWTDEEKGQPGYARPWSRPDDPAFVKKIDQITDAIIAENARSLKILRTIASGTGVTLPPASKSHQVDKRYSRDIRSPGRLPVKVRIHYMIGNHDWYYHLPGAGLDAVRQKIVDAMSLSNQASPFPYVQSEAQAVDHVLQQHSVFARHGDYHDRYNLFEKNRDHASISDAVCVELFNRIGVQIRRELQGKVPDGFFDDLDEMGSIRPELMTPVWIASLLERYNVKPEHRKKINEIWHDLVDNFLKLDFLDELNRPLQFDLVDGIRSAMKFFNLFSMDDLMDWAPAIERLKGLLGMIIKDSLTPENWVLQEPAYQRQEARFIVYGHTHQPVVCPMRSARKYGTPFDQFYLNSGTWHPVHELCRGEANKKGFVYHKSMSYIGLYKGDERRCKSFETWSGTLDI